MEQKSPNKTKVGAKDVFISLAFPLEALLDNHHVCSHSIVRVLLVRYLITTHFLFRLFVFACAIPCVFAVTGVDMSAQVWFLLACVANTASDFN